MRLNLKKLLIIAFLLYFPSQLFGANVEGVSKTYPRGLSAIDSPSDGECFAFDSTTNRGEWVSCGGASGDNVSIDGVAVADPNFASTGQIDFVDASNTVTANINDNSILEADLKAVDSASDEDILTYESTTGDFEWHSPTDLEAGFEAVLDLSDLQGTVTDAQVPDSITVDSANAVEGTDLGTLTDGKICVYDLANTEIDCNYTDQTGAGGGDEVSIDGAGVTNPNFASTGDIDFVDTTNTVTANLNASSVVAGDMANGDHGDFTYSSNSATLDANTVDTNELADGTLDALSAYNTNGLVTQTSADTFTGRTITGTSLDITVSNGSGVSGNPTLSLDRTATLAGDPALSASTVGLAATGLIFEGATADTLEGLLSSADITGSDKTWTLPNTTGTIITTGDSGTVTGTMVLNDTIALTTDTSGNYVGNVATDVLTGLTGGSAGSEGASLSVGFDYSQAMSGSVSLGANATVFGSNGLVSEGSTANTIEGFITFPNWATSDKTIAFPDASGTVAVSATSPLALSAGGALSINADGIGTTQVDETANYSFTGTVTNDGTNPTCNASGQICEDTTNNQLIVGNGNVFDNERTVCVTVPDVTSTDDNFNFFMANEAMTVTKVGCRYEGTGTTVATFSLEDNSGNAMTHTSPTCVTSTNSATYQSVTSGGGLVAGEGLRFDTTNTPSPTTDDYTLCVVYTVDRQ